MTVRENIEFGLLVRKLASSAKTPTNEVIELLDLGDTKRKGIHYQVDKTTSCVGERLGY